MSIYVLLHQEVSLSWCKSFAGKKKKKIQGRLLHYVCLDLMEGEEWLELVLFLFLFFMKGDYTTLSLQRRLDKDPQ